MDILNHGSFVGELQIPHRLLMLIERGLWPRTEIEERKQMVAPIVSKERIHLFAPEWDRIYFLRPPFFTVAKRLSGGQAKFWRTSAAVESISPELSIDIGDFGLGSDSPLLLDYRGRGATPRVIRLRLGGEQSKEWVQCADTFDDFADMLGLG